MRAGDALEALELLGSSQWGLVTVAQAAAAGVSRVWLSRLSEKGTLTRERQGVYALPSAGHGPLQSLRAAWLSTEPKLMAGERARSEDPVVVAGQSAALVHELGDLIPSAYDFISIRRRQTSQSDVRLHRRDLQVHEIDVVDGLPVTSIPRTVADLARAHTDRDHLAGVVRDALESPSVSVTALAKVLDAGAKQYGASSGSELVAEMAADSAMAVKLVDLLSHVSTPLVADAALQRLRQNLIAALAPNLPLFPEAFVKGLIDSEAFKNIIPKFDTEVLLAGLSPERFTQQLGMDSLAMKEIRDRIGTMHNPAVERLSEALRESAAAQLSADAAEAPRNKRPKEVTDGTDTD